MVKAEKSLQKYQTELENLVRERTAALIATNAELNREISEHRQTEKALRESEARFRAIFEGAPIGISLQDHQGRVLAVNPALHQILGGAPGENGLEDSLHPDDSEAFHTLFQDLAEGGGTISCRSSGSFARTATWCGCGCTFPKSKAPMTNPGSP
jgi:PAS domain-containing protein